MIISGLQKDSTQTKSKKIFNQFLCKWIGYFNGEINHITINSENEFFFEKLGINQKLPPLLIVGRQFFSEKSTKYPIVNRGELKKLLNLEFNGDEYVKYHIWDASDGYSQVNVWKFSPKIPKAAVLIPESLLLSLLAENNQIIDVSKNSNLFVMRQSNVVHSTIRTSFIDNVQNFAHSVGAAQKNNVFSVSENQLPKYLISGIKKMSLSLIGSFIFWPKTTQKISIVNNIFIPFFLILSGYLLLSSLFIVYKQNALEQLAMHNKDKISSSLLQEENLNDASKRYYALKEFFSTQHNNLRLWDIMSNVFPKANFTNIRFENNRYVLRGTTMKATDLLETLADINQVHDAKFDYPTRKSKAVESFVISFMLINNTQSTLENIKNKVQINE